MGVIYPRVKLSWAMEGGGSAQPLFSEGRLVKCSTGQTGPAALLPLFHIPEGCFEDLRPCSSNTTSPNAWMWNPPQILHQLPICNPSSPAEHVCLLRELLGACPDHPVPSVDLRFPGSPSQREFCFHLNLDLNTQSWHRVELSNLPKVSQARKWKSRIGGHILLSDHTLLITTVWFCLERNEEKEVGRKERSSGLETATKDGRHRQKGGWGGKEAGRGHGGKKRGAGAKSRWGVPPLCQLAQSASPFEPPPQGRGMGVTFSKASLQHRPQNSSTQLSRGWGLSVLFFF